MHLIFSAVPKTRLHALAAGIKLSLSDDRPYLKVTEVSEEHNHEISKVNLSVVSVYSVRACATRLSACIFTILYMCMSVCRESCI